MLSGFAQTIKSLNTETVWGTVSSVNGLVISVAGFRNLSSIGNFCKIITTEREIPAEVVGFEGSTCLLMAYDTLQGVGPGCRVEIVRQRMSACPDRSWMGRVINGLGQPIDKKGPILLGNQEYNLNATAIPANDRNRLGPRMNLGVRAINTFITCCRGQRLGVFAGSGVGKSVLLAQMARYSSADVNVIGLIGERGREVREFIEDYLGEEGLAKTVLIIATSDESALIRRQAANLTLTVAEYFRDQGNHVLCMIDSITRIAMAMREIGLSVGEPPTSRGYTPSVFTELPRILERAGPGHESGNGDITGMISVLVDGDDHNEPIADAVRGILDGHLVLSRKIAEYRFPAIDILKSISRSMPGCNSAEETRYIQAARRLMSTYEDMEDMIRLGAYRKGSDSSVDQSIEFHNKLEHFLTQDINEFSDLEDGFRQLRELLAPLVENDN